MQTKTMQPAFAVWFFAAATLILTGLLIQHWGNTGRTLLDTDDAMRLVEMRDWLAGQGWFDLRQYRIALPYESHWSRLVDAGLAGMYLVFRHFTDTEFAERLLRAIWPLLWVLPTLAGACAVAWRIDGRRAALMVLLFAVAGVPAYQQFAPGRIDHHNVQIALCMLTVAATVWSDRRLWCAAAVGALTALALAIGFESLPYLAACGAVLALRFIFDPAGGAALRLYGLSLAGSLCIAFLLSVGVDRWSVTHCDAFALNSAMAIGAGAIVLAAATLPRAQAIWMRAATAGIAGLIMIGVLAALQPRCLAGPYAMVDPAIWPIWLAGVRENQPLLRVLAENPLTGVAISAFPAATLVMIALQSREMHARRDFAFFASAGAFVLASITMIAAIRAYSYAMWLGMPLAAVATLRVFALLHLRTAVAQFAAALLLTPFALSSGAITVAAAAGLEDRNNFARPESRHCFDSDAYRPLARLPRGLMAADVSYGPFILALTPHSVLAGPYHRLGAGILASHRALASDPAAARADLSAVGADYLVICGPRPPDGLDGAERERSLWAALRAGIVPDWLQRVPDTGAFSVFRLKRS
jgi:hypothetical protein